MKKNTSSHKDIVDLLNNLEKAGEKVVKEQHMPTLRPISADKALRILNRRNPLKK